MAYKQLPHISLLRQLVAYNPETGVLTWLQRPVTMFTARTVRHRSGKIMNRPAQAVCDWWNTRFAGTPAFAISSELGHLKGHIDRQHFAAHRVAWALYYGEEPSGQIDHINGRPDDNRIANLRVVTPRENQRNQAIGCRNKSGVCGVSYLKRDRIWAAKIGDGNGGDIRLGSFKTREEAVAARRIAEQELGYHPNHGTRLSAASKRLASSE